MESKELQEELKRFEGRWKLISYIRNGKSWDVAGMEETINLSGEFKVFKNGDLISRGCHTFFNLNANPREFTNVYLIDADREGFKTLAIYRLQDDILETCHAPKEIGRPDDFISSPGSGRSHAILKRIDVAA